MPGDSEHDVSNCRDELKLARLAAAVAGALLARGVPEPSATIAAQSGVTVFGVAFAQRIGEAETRSLAAIQDAGLTALKEMAR